MSGATVRQGTEALLQEADAIRAAAERLDAESFERAVQLLAACTGNVATLGAGTSGIVARKIAATFTSTGTPAFYVHPGDALHGGLGLIGEQEVAVAVSNSGETEEVLALMPYLRSRNVSVISLVGNPGSSLASQSAIVLDAGVAREAGHLDLVPTASVVVALAIADALALSVMALKGVTPESFAANHPSGRLGRRLTLRVADVMHPRSELPTVAPASPLLDVLKEMTSGGVGAVPVLEGAELAGIITDGDIRRTVQRCDAERLTSLTADGVMTVDPVVVDGESMAYDALRLMENRPSQISVLPVVSGRELIGLVRLHDLVQVGL